MPLCCLIVEALKFGNNIAKNPIKQLKKKSHIQKKYYFCRRVIYWGNGKCDTPLTEWLAKYKPISIGRQTDKHRTIAMMGMV